MCECIIFHLQVINLEDIDHVFHWARIEIVLGNEFEGRLMFLVCFLYVSDPECIEYMRAGL